MKRKRITPSFFIICSVVFILSIMQILPLSLFTGEANVLQVDAAEKSDGKTIVIDAGHGGYDSGSVSQYDDYEKDITLSIALQCGALLESNGYRVIYTRDSDIVSWSNDNKDDLRTRVAIGENADADYFISIHLNASDYNDGAQGYEIYINESDQTITQMAKDLSKLLDEAQYSTNRGIKDTSDNTLYVVDSNTVPAMLVELGFISDQMDLRYLTSKSGQQTLASCIAQSIMANT